MGLVLPIIVNNFKERNMNKLMVALAAALFCISTAQAQDKKPADKPAAPQAAAAKPLDQKQKMSYCNKEAATKQLKGDERKKFMSECLKG
jgi:ribosomal protein L12E/L44/L45/RPP1/RPP2